jgi:hypothetical protein
MFYFVEDTAYVCVSVCGSLLFIHNSSTILSTTAYRASYNENTVYFYYNYNFSSWEKQILMHSLCGGWFSLHCELWNNNERPGAYHLCQ